MIWYGAARVIEQCWYRRRGKGGSKINYHMPVLGAGRKKCIVHKEQWLEEQVGGII